MRYYLEDIKTILENAGYSNIHINLRIDENNKTSLGEAILLYARTGSSDVNNPTETRNFEVYVRRANGANAANDSENIYQLLDSFQGGSATENISFNRIESVQSPQPFHVSNMFEYVMEFETYILNFERGKIK